MTELRDARLRRALQAADEAPHGPSLRTREAVLKAAREAAAVPAPWWKRLGTSRAAMPWNAAFATLAVAVLVTLVWEGREVPGARPDATADIQAPAPAAPPASVPGSAAAPPTAAPAAAPAADQATRSQAPAPVPQGPAERAREAPRQDSAATAPARRAAPPAPAPPAPAPTLAPAPAPVPSPGSRHEAAPVLPAPATGPETQRAPPAPAARESRAAAETVARDSALAKAAPAAGPAPATAAAPAAAPAPIAPPPPAGAATLAAQSLSWESWTELRIASGGREVVLSRRRAEALADMINRMARTAQSVAAGPSAGPRSPVASFELSTRGTLLAVLELSAEHTVLFLPVGESGPSRTVRLDPAESQALWEETQRLLAR